MARTSNKIINKGKVKILGRAGCQVGEVRLSIDGKCHRLLYEHPRSYSFNVRNKRTGRVISTVTGGMNVFSGILRDAKKISQKDDAVLTVEKILWDSKIDKPLSGLYMYRDKNILQTGFVNHAP